MSEKRTIRPPARKRWGQNFLTDPNALRAIADALGEPAGEKVIEIGPGRGALTRVLLDRGFEVEAWEIDPMLVAFLREELDDPRLTLHNIDALDASLPDVPFRAVGNLPYNVANPIIRRILWSARWSRAVFMVQAEVANRYTARSGDADWGYLSASTALVARAKKLLTLGPGSFRPRPKVRSTVVVFEPESRAWKLPANEIEAMMAAAFRQRRKKLTNNLSNYRGLGKARAEEALERAGVEPSARAEQLTLDEMERLALAISEICRNA